MKGLKVHTCICVAMAAPSSSPDFYPREPSVSWSARAEGYGDSPGRLSMEQSIRTVNVSRGDSLAYSEDSQDQQNLLPGTSAFNSSIGKITPTPKTDKHDVLKPASSARNKQQRLAESMPSDDSLEDAPSKKACCIIQ